MITEVTEQGRFYVRIEKRLDNVLAFPICTYYRDGQERKFSQADAYEMIHNFIRIGL